MVEQESRRAPIRTPLVTGAGGADAVTTVAANLAALVARDVGRVLVVGLDLRDPRLHLPFGLEAEPGVADVLADGASVADPVHLLRSPAAQSLLADGLTGYDLVVHVAAPLPLADSLVVAPAVDAALLVVAAGAATDDVAAAADQLRTTEVRVPGVVLTGGAAIAGH